MTLLLVGYFLTSVQAAEQDPYDHLYEVIMIRTDNEGKPHGGNSASPLAFRNSRYLFEGAAASRFLKALDTFQGLSAEEMSRYSPVQRALLQRHLWAVFDWTTRRQASWWKEEPGDVVTNRIKFQEKIASLIRRLALSKEEILKLPNTLLSTTRSKKYASEYDPKDHLKPFLPPGLGQTNSAWVSMQRYGATITAMSHTDEAIWRSAFHVFMRLPGGRDRTVQYLKTLADYRGMWVTDKPEDERFTTPNGGLHYAGVYVNPETPQFPVGTQVALVEQALLISDNGELVPSPLFLTVQLRAYIDMNKRNSAKPKQAFAEFVLRPNELIKGNPVMAAIGRDEVHMTTMFRNDPFESPKSNRQPSANLGSCISCHSAWGIHSVNTRSQLFETRQVTVPRFREGSLESTARATAWEKEKHYTWGLLKGLWR